MKIRRNPRKHNLLTNHLIDTFIFIIPWTSFWVLVCAKHGDGCCGYTVTSKTLSMSSASTKSPLKCRDPHEANGMSCCFMGEARANMGIEQTGQVSSGFWDLRLIYLLVNWLFWSEVSYSLWWEGLLFWKLLFAVHLRAPLRMVHTRRVGDTDTLNEEPGPRSLSYQAAVSSASGRDSPTFVHSIWTLPVKPHLPLMRVGVGSEVGW